VDALIRDYTRAPVSAADRALLDYAIKLTRQPWTMTREDVKKLRAAGFSESAILDANLVASYYAFVNRLADGLGVDLESKWGDKAKKK
jgi:uncharacterized peroxidase-related enzyme